MFLTGLNAQPSTGLQRCLHGFWNGLYQGWVFRVLYGFGDLYGFIHIKEGFEHGFISD